MQTLVESAIRDKEKNMSRRNFMRSCGMGAAALPLTPSLGQCASALATRPAGGTGRPPDRLPQMTSMNPRADITQTTLQETVRNIVETAPVFDIHTQRIGRRSHTPHGARDPRYTPRHHVLRKIPSASSRFRKAQRFDSEGICFPPRIF